MPTDPTRQAAHDQPEAPARQAEGAMGPEQKAAVEGLAGGVWPQPKSTVYAGVGRKAWPFDDTGKSFFGGWDEMLAEAEVLVLERGKSFGSELERGKSFGSELLPPRDMGPNREAEKASWRVLETQPYRPDWASRAFRKALQGCE